MEGGEETQPLAIYTPEVVPRDGQRSRRQFLPTMDDIVPGHGNTPAATTSTHPMANISTQSHTNLKRTDGYSAIARHNTRYSMTDISGIESCPGRATFARNRTIPLLKHYRSTSKALSKHYQSTIKAPSKHY